MWRVALKGALGHRARLVISGLVVGASVAFVVATLVFTDTLSSSFESLFEDSFAGFDLQVRSEIDPELVFSVPAPLDEEVLGTVRAVDGVTQAQGSVTGFLQIEGPDGTAVESVGPPIIGLTWPSVPSIAEIREGSEPKEIDEVAIDAATAERFSIAVGDHIVVVGLGGPQPVRVTGIVDFAGAESAGGAITVFSTVELGRLLFDLAGRYSSIEVVVGDDAAATADRIRDAVGDGIEVLAAEDLARQQVEGFQDAIGFIRTFVLVFAGVALFVGTFVISNIFRVTIAQRTRELAVLRAIGATAAQIRTLMLAEAAVISALASAVGAVSGLGLASLIRRGFDAAAIPLPDGPLRVTATTVVAGVGTGVAVTLASALIPAVKAATVSPIEAMREGLSPPSRGALRRRIGLGLPTVAAGGAALAIGLFAPVPEVAPDPIWFVGTGAVLLFVGVAVLTAVFARPAAAVLGRPVAGALGLTGRLARENAMRSPRRTGLTASALMISLALVGLVSILAESASTTADRLIEDRFRADLIIAPTGFTGLGFSPEVARELSGLDEVERVGRLRQGQVLVDGDVTLVTAGTAEAFELVVFDVVDGDLRDLGRDTVAVRDEDAAIGDRIDIVFPVGGSRTLEVVATYRASPSAYVVSMDTYEAGFSERLDAQVLVRLAPSVGFEGGRAAVEAAIAEFPSIQLQDQEAFRNEATGQIGGIVNVLYALLAVSVVIGTLGVVGTLLLSVVERTRELGILRAVGMQRRQVRRMVTWEAVIIAMFGGALGTAIGVLFGVSVVTAIGDELSLAMPFGQLSIWLAVAALLGVVAAVLPARRAARLDVLEAIAYE